MRPTLPVIHHSNCRLVLLPMLPLHVNSITSPSPIGYGLFTGPSTVAPNLVADNVKLEGKAIKERYGYKKRQAQLEMFAQ